MQKIELANNCMYEFEIDANLVDEAADYFFKLPDLSLNQLSVDKNDFQSFSRSMFRKTNEKNYIPLYHKELFHQILSCVNQVSLLHFESLQLGISDAWLTKTTFMQDSRTHHHTNSVFSGLLYLTDHEKSETLFYMEDEFYNHWEKILKVKRVIHFYKSFPRKGKLLIFPSYISHKIGKHLDKKTRHTLSFNTWVNGTTCSNPTEYLESYLIDSNKLNELY